jgi:hypothetical protein
MRPYPILAAFAAVGLAGAAAAQERPRYIPTRDVTVRYDVTSDQPDVPPRVVVHFSSAGKVRIDTEDRGYVLYDLDTGRARWVLAGTGIYVDMPTHGSLATSFIPDQRTQFARTGHSTVAGLPCAEWHVTVPNGSGNACVTEDGVILRGTGGDAKGHTGSIVATSVTFAPQPPELFEPPPGAHRVTLPRGMPLPQMQ